MSHPLIGGWSGRSKYLLFVAERGRVILGVFTDGKPAFALTPADIALLRSPFATPLLADGLEAPVVTQPNATPDPFDSDVITETADEFGLDAASLAEIVRRHQESMAALPGIENLAYEWRKRYESPLVDRTTTTYHFAVPEQVWTEFGDALDLAEAARDALVEVHRRTVAARTDADPTPSEAVAYVVLVRSFDESGPTEP